MLLGMVMMLVSLDIVLPINISLDYDKSISLFLRREIKQPLLPTISRIDNIIGNGALTITKLYTIAV